MTQVEWQRTIADRADVVLVAFDWDITTALPWVILQDSAGHEWCWTAVQYRDPIGWCFDVTVERATQRQPYLVMMHTHTMATRMHCSFVSRRPPASILDEVITRGRRYASRLLEGAA